MKTHLAIEGMHCNACAERLARAFEGVPGVEAVTVTLNPPRAKLESDHPLDPDALAGAAKSAGSYTVREVPSQAVPEPVQVIGEEPPKSLYPLWLIVGYIAGVSALVTWALPALGGAPVELNAHTLHAFMNSFMAGFFLVFSFFKLLNLRGFAMSYRMYDLLAAAIPPWAYVYPFIELALGIAYLLRWQPFAVNIATLALMLIGASGVLNALRTKSATRCACLGTALNLPLTAVTLTEDLGMGAMALAMLLWLG